MSGLEGLLLGVLQGLTEFLPVSSSGHLLMAQTFLGVAGEGLVFEVAVHVASLLSIGIFYRRRLAALARGCARGQAEALGYAGKLALATAPVVALGLGARGFLEAQFERPAVTGVGLLVTGALLWTTRHSLPRAAAPAPGWGAALLIGCAQAAALLPGVSRSGSTVAVALALGVEPLAAAEFSFLLGMVAIAGAAALWTPQLAAVSAVQLPPIALGAAAALVTGVGAIWLFVQLLRRRSFYAFAYYLWPLGALFLTWLALQR